MNIKIDIKKDFGSFKFHIILNSSSSTLALLGASGSGKTMTLKCIAGIIKPDEGYIILNDRVLFDSENKINVKTQLRNVGYMFQDYCLFPNINVKSNIACGLRKYKLTKEENEQKIKEVIELLQLQGLEDRKPHQLSGGQKQRVALARILVGNPDILLLDEPFSALDEYLRTRLEMSTKEIINKYKIPTILVTHNRDEAYLLSDEIAIIDDGKVITQKETHELFKNPEYVHAAILSGCKNIISIRHENGKTLLPQWGIELIGQSEGYSHIGIRANSFKEGNKDNGYQIKIIDINEEPFEKLIRFRFVNQDKTSEDIYWKIPKDKPNPSSSYVTFDKKDILYLKDN